ncbi:MAG: sugar phosphate nucleotidyltransferase [Patescibacteria group bacterium]
MQAIILAAGSHEHSQSREPIKCLLKVGREPLLCHLTRELPPEISEIIIVVGRQKNQVKEIAGRTLAGRTVRYVTQNEQLGTGHALSLCRPIIHTERFLVLMGDNLYLKSDIKACLKHPRAILTKKIDAPERYGLVSESGHLLVAVTEKPKNPNGALINCGLYVLDHKIFDIPLAKIGEDEYGLPQQVANLSAIYPVAIEQAQFWLPVSTIEDLKQADKYLRRMYS